MYFKSFMAFSSPVLQQRDRMRSINFHDACIILLLKRLGNELDLLARDKIQNDREYLHNHFSFTSFCICANW